MEMTANIKVHILAGYSDCSLCFKLLHQLDATLFIGRQQNPHLKWFLSEKPHSIHLYIMEWMCKWEREYFLDSCIYISRVGNDFKSQIIKKAK